MKQMPAILKRPSYFGTSLAFLFFLLTLITAQLYSTNQITSQPPLKPASANAKTPKNIPVRLPNTHEPTLSAASALVVDLESSAVLFAKNPSQPLMPASTTKIMTALTALSHYSLEEVVTITNEPEIKGQKIDLQPGEQITVKNLLYGSLISSGNDAALALAQHHPQGLPYFVQLMNQHAKDLKLHQTHFTNPVGLEDPQHLTTVADLAILTKEALTHPLLQQIVKIKHITISDQTGTIHHSLENTNQLLGEVEGIFGVKTGWTENAGECLVSYTVRQNHPIIVVVLSSQDRFGETEILTEWIYQSHQWQTVRPQ